MPKKYAQLTGATTQQEKMYKAKLLICKYIVLFLSDSCSIVKNIPKLQLEISRLVFIVFSNKSVGKSVCTFFFHLSILQTNCVQTFVLDICIGENIKKNFYFFSLQKQYTRNKICLCYKLEFRRKPVKKVAL